MSGVVDLFSGIGAFALGAKKAGLSTELFCEFADFPSRVLRKHFPNVPNYGDIRDLSLVDFPVWSSADILVGGFPCTDLSNASHGSHLGLKGEESGLFFEMVRVAWEMSPDWIVIENVPQVIKYIDIIQDHLFGWDLAHRIYDAQDFGALNRRRRAFIVGCSYEGAAESVLKKVDLMRTSRQAGKLPMCLPWKGGPSLERLGSCLVEPAESATWVDPTIMKRPRGENSDRYLALGNSIPVVFTEALMSAIRLVEEAEIEKDIYCQL